MRVDREALRKIANKGEAKDRVEVNRQWLRAVLSELEELDRVRKRADPPADPFSGLFGRGR